MTTKILVLGMVLLGACGRGGDASAFPRNCPGVVFQSDGLSPDLAATGRLLVDLARHMEELRDGHSSDVGALVAAGTPAEVAEIVAEFHRLDLDPRPTSTSAAVDRAFAGAYDESLRAMIGALGVDDALRGLGVGSEQLVEFDAALRGAVYHRSTGRAVLADVATLDNGVPQGNGLRDDALALWDALLVTFPPAGDCGRIGTGG